MNMLKRMANFAEKGPTVPWLPRYADLRAVRRAAARLRSGALRPADPTLDPQEAAWVLERAVDGELRHTGEQPWCSAPVEWRGWSDLQQRAIALLGEDGVPHLLNTDACRGVFLPVDVEACGVTNFAGDPAVLDVGALDSLIEELERFARRRALPTGDDALLELPEKVDDGDLALLTYAQVLRAAHYARRARMPLWVVR